jgi:hypothetical protein
MEMTNTKLGNHPSPKSHYEANDTALSLAQAENALRAFSSDQVDAVIDADGKTYLLRPDQEHLIQKQRWLDSVIESAADGTRGFSKSSADHVEPR